MGRFTLRLPETLHNELETRAEQEGVSLNQYIIYMLTRQVSSTYTIQVLPEHNVKEQKASYEKLLDSLGNASLEETKAFLAERDTVDPEEGLTEDVIAQLEKRMAESSA